MCGIIPTDWNGMRIRNPWFLKTKSLLSDILNTVFANEPLVHGIYSRKFRLTYSMNIHNRCFSKQGSAPRRFGTVAQRSLHSFSPLTHLIPGWLDVHGRYNIKLILFIFIKHVPSRYNFRVSMMCLEWIWHCKHDSPLKTSIFSNKK